MAGAGMSLAAGYPSAQSLMQSLSDEMKPGARATAGTPREDFSVVAQNFEKKFDRKTLVDRVSGAILHSDAFGPTRAHIAAVRVFDTIVTTNFDLLFEAACRAVGRSCVTVTPKSRSPKFPKQGLVIFKIDGSIEQPESLVLTKRDVKATAADAIWFWDSVKQRLAGNPLVIVGHALREASAKRVPGARLHASGAYVAPFLSDAEKFLIDKYKLIGIRADADSFMIAYEQAIAAQK